MRSFHRAPLAVVLLVSGCTAEVTGPVTSLFHATESAFPGMMVALRECGPIPDQ